MENIILPVIEETDLINAINTIWVSICAAMIFFMEGGFAFLESGFVRAKNAMSIIAKVIIDVIFGGIAFFTVGFGIAYGYSNGWFAFDLGIMQYDLGLNLTVSNNLFWFIQFGFAVAAISIVSGALAERMKLWPFLIFTVLLTAFLYPIEASWQWGEGWLYKLGFKDFAGSTLVHAAGASAALAGAIVLGPRIGKYKDDGSVNPMPGSNMPLATLGTFILWLGWFGFNGGSQLALGSIGNAADVSRIFTNTNTAAAGGALAALILTQLMYKKIDLTMVLNGALAGLVSITAEPLAPSIGGATLIGAVGGAIVVFAVPMLDKLRVDDVVGAISVHGIAGIWGTMAVVFSGGSFGAQIIGTVSICLFIFILSLVIWYILDLIIGIRVSEEDELTGLDTTELGMDAYPDFSKS